MYADLTMSMIKTNLQSQMAPRPTLRHPRSPGCGQDHPNVCAGVSDDAGKAREALVAGGEAGTLVGDAMRMAIHSATSVPMSLSPGWKWTVPVSLSPGRTGG